MAKNIIGNNDGENGENETFNIPGRGTGIPRETIVKEIESGKHPDFHTYERDGVKYPRANPNSTSGDNVNRDS